MQSKCNIEQTELRSLQCAQPKHWHLNGTLNVEANPCKIEARITSKNSLTFLELESTNAKTSTLNVIVALTKPQTIAMNSQNGRVKKEVLRRLSFRISCMPLSAA